MTTRHTVKLAHGWRIECETHITDRKRRAFAIEAAVYRDATWQHTDTLLISGVKTNGDLIDKRNAFLDGITKSIERRAAASARADGYSRFVAIFARERESHVRRTMFINT